ncbi:BLUF domain-containing protein [Mucilaginibacter corticis]|uniref:BLUF domain-containing protein n=1 Tax=Mucilaginibacter corticis TaxID=2597670 RepID=A0A556M9L3_9SPHI|nr:BLUF domain-containing protein [Mucilaginibacter corticis]TSJ36561.1 BLUF domain-containing protein [Mucilaginibacter corticis]
MNYLVYLSTAVKLFSGEELEQILAISRINNVKNNLTGLLLYHDGSFIQLLEGEPSDLADTYSRIQTDNRHKNLIVIDEGELEERIFANWNMGFHQANGEEAAQLQAYTDPQSIKDWPSDLEHPVFTMLKTFVNTNLR